MLLNALSLSLSAHAEAIEKIASVRSVVCPAEFFLHQLELYERCNCEVDPSKYPEYRRFLMNFNAQEMIGEFAVVMLVDRRRDI